MEKPLAYRLKPEKLDDIIGQEHLVGKGKVLRNLIKNKKLISMILYGPPGSGKTSIAHALVNELGLNYRMLNATINNKKDFDTVVEEAKYLGGMVVVMDEIHRLNKDKQDLLLPYLENGLITLIGLTTANPYHSINPSIRSRCQIFEVKPLTDDDIYYGINKVLKSDEFKKYKFTKEGIDYILGLANGDYRFALNLIEVAAITSKEEEITLSHLEEIAGKPNVFHDKDGDGYYNLLSALQKSIRGSDVDASLHYLARLIEFGELDSILRRLIVIAYEDIGLANPGIGPKVIAAVEACERVGLPEATIPLSVIVVEMALSPKSNTAMVALNEALNDVRNNKVGPIPTHIRLSAEGYKYPHDYPNSWVKQEYIPENLKNKQYFKPKDESKNEKILKEIYEKLNKMKK
ncbi:MAG TPA: replication-associated recombination protein A [Tenericutes bacterium]|nr:replication-associated recombination protein A [Mycoplasmatota bacterium]